MMPRRLGPCCTWSLALSLSLAWSACQIDRRPPPKPPPDPPGPPPACAVSSFFPPSSSLLTAPPALDEARRNEAADTLAPLRDQPPPGTRWPKRSRRLHRPGAAARGAAGELGDRSARAVPGARRALSARRGSALGRTVAPGALRRALRRSRHQPDGARLLSPASPTTTSAARTGRPGFAFAYSGADRLGRRPTRFSAAGRDPPGRRRARRDRVCAEAGSRSPAGTRSRPSARQDPQGRPDLATVIFPRWLKRSRWAWSGPIAIANLAGNAQLFEAFPSQSVLAQTLYNAFFISSPEKGAPSPTDLPGVRALGQDLLLSPARGQQPHVYGDRQPPSCRTPCWPPTGQSRSPPSSPRGGRVTSRPARRWRRRRRCSQQGRQGRSADLSATSSSGSAARPGDLSYLRAHQACPYYNRAHWGLSLIERRTDRVLGDFSERRAELEALADSFRFRPSPTSTSRSTARSAGRAQALSLRGKPVVALPPGAGQLQELGPSQARLRAAERHFRPGPPARPAGRVRKGLSTLRRPARGGRAGGGGRPGRHLPVVLRGRHQHPLSRGRPPPAAGRAGLLAELPQAALRRRPWPETAS